MGIIIAGFPCIGKTTLGKVNNLNIIDLESTRYKYLLEPEIENLESIKLNVDYPRNPDWPENYIKAIEEARQKFDIVFVLGRYDFNLQMLERGIEFWVAYPDPTVQQKEEYLARARRRNNPKEFIKIFSDNYEKWQNRMDLLPVPKIKLQKGEYIGDAIERLGIYKFKENEYEER